MDDSSLAVAVAALADRDYQAAGDAYSRAGWRGLAEPREELSPFDTDEKVVTRSEGSTQLNINLPRGPEAGRTRFIELERRQ